MTDIEQPPLAPLDRIPAEIHCAEDYATLARSMGLYGEGPIANPRDLGPALKRAVERVEKGEPALVDVVTQPR